MDKVTQKLIEIEAKLDLILAMVKARNAKNSSDSDMEYIKQKNRVEALIGKARYLTSKTK